jgi:hypothetical protein
VAAQIPAVTTANTKGRTPKNFPFFSRMREDTDKDVDMTNSNRVKEENKIGITRTIRDYREAGYDVNTF